MLGVELSSNIALDFLQGLYDIYVDLRDDKRDEALNNLRVLAILMIAGTLNVGKEVIDELLAEEFANFDIDKAFQDLISEETNE